MQELGHGCIYMVQKAGALQLSPTDSFSKRELIECARAVMEKVRHRNTPAGMCLLGCFFNSFIADLVVFQMLHHLCRATFLAFNSLSIVEGYRLWTDTGGHPNLAG